MLLLAFDTATAAITAAVHDGARIVGEAETTGAMAHGEQLAPTIRAAMQQAGAAMSDLTDVAVGVGPGPFTGLRVGVVTALTLGSTLDLRTHGVCTLDVIAADVAAPHVDRGAEFLVATDARRKEVYWARYAATDGVDVVRLDGPHVSAPADLAVQHPHLPVHGPGAVVYSDVLRSAGDVRPRAAALAQLVASGRHDDLPLEPLYLRRPDAQPR